MSWERCRGVGPYPKRNLSIIPAAPDWKYPSAIVSDTLEARVLACGVGISRALLTAETSCEPTYAQLDTSSYRRICCEDICNLLQTDGGYSHREGAEDTCRVGFVSRR